jgi:3-polyprenyl-4-hydroxybenzoate decarboxylase
MTFDSLRDFLAVLGDNGQPLRIKNEVAPEPDLGAAGRAVNELGENAPALLFENILGFEDARVALNVHGSWPNNALMLGLDKNTPVESVLATEQCAPVPVIVRRGLTTSNRGLSMLVRGNDFDTFADKAEMSMTPIPALRLLAGWSLGPCTTRKHRRTALG